MLTTSEVPRGLDAHRRRLRDALRRSGIEPPWWWHYGPHITLLYGSGPGSSGEIERISWEVDEMVLIHSLLRRAQHRTLGCWPLRAQAVNKVGTD